MYNHAAPYMPPFPTPDSSGTMQGEGRHMSMQVRSGRQPSYEGDPGEDWTKITDFEERRRIQSRIAQRTYRRKRKSTAAASQASSTTASTASSTTSPRQQSLEMLKPSPPSSFGSFRMDPPSSSWSNTSPQMPITRETSFAPPGSISRNLLAVMPEKSSIDFISGLVDEMPAHLHAFSRSPRDAAQGQIITLADCITLASLATEPVFPARALMVLAICLRTLPRMALEQLERQNINHDRIASAAVDAVRRLVLSNEELSHSREGVQCLALDSIYSSNAGALRRAWLSMRRAIAIAQILGLHRSLAEHTAAEGGAPSTGPDDFWFRLVQSDRYLSLMLGLPQAVPCANRLAKPDVLASCSPVERLERLQCSAAGYILQQVDSGDGDIELTTQTDQLLHEAALAMPAKWWLIPSFSTPAGSSLTRTDSRRLMLQFTHFHLVCRLHLPHLLKTPVGDECQVHDSHKAATINASREILTRYVAFRNSGVIDNFCRSVDLLMLVASVTLCIAHIILSHQRRKAKAVSPSFTYLGHQRLGDRGLVERALELVESMSCTAADIIASKIAATLRILLVSEADAADGAGFVVSSSSAIRSEARHGELEERGNALRLFIPGLGRIDIYRDDGSGANGTAHSYPVNHQPVQLNERSNGAASGLPGQGTSAGAMQQTGLANPFMSMGDTDLESLFTADLFTSSDDWALNGVDASLFDNIICDQ